MAPDEEMVDLGGGMDDQQEQIFATIISAGEQAGDAVLQAGGDHEAASDAAASKAVEVAAQMGLMPHEAVDPTARASAQSALNAASAADPTPMLTDISQCLDGDVIKQIKAESRRRNATTGDIVRKGDADRSDNIAPHELRAIFHKMNLSLPDDTLQQVYVELDLDNTGQISFAEFTRALDRGSQLRKEVGKAAAAAAGKAMGQAALAVGFPPDHAAGIAAKGAAKAALDMGLPASSAARLAGRAAARIAEENGLSQSERAELAAKEAGNAASNAALQNGLSRDQMAVEAGAAGTVAATDAGMSPQDAAAAGAKAAGVAAGEAMADAGETPEKAAEAAVKAAIKASSDAGLSPHQASHAAASAAASAAACAAMSSGHSYPTVAEVAKQLDAKVFEDLRQEAQRRHITPDDLMRSGDAGRTDLLSPGELKDVFRSVCIDLHDDTLSHVFQEMDGDSTGQVSFTEFLAALDHGHQIVLDAGKKAAGIAGHFMGKAATEAGDDPEQAAEVAANAASKAAADSGLLPEQIAEAAVTAAGRTAGDAAAATASCTPEQAADMAGRAATRAASGAAMSPQSLAQAIVPLIGRASGQAAGRAAGASGKDPSKAAERAARAAAQVAENMSLTPQQAEEAAEAASNEAVKAAVAAGKRAGNARGSAKGRGKATAGRGVAAKAGPGSPGRGAGRGSSSPSRPASAGPAATKQTPSSSRSASPKAPARSPRQPAKSAAPKASTSPKAPTAAKPKDSGQEQAKRPASSRPGAAKSPGPSRAGAKAKAAAAQSGREGELASPERAASSRARAGPGRSGKESGKGSGKARVALGPGRDSPRTEGAVVEEVAQRSDQVEVEPPLPSDSMQTMQAPRTEAFATMPPMTMFAEPVTTRQGQVPPPSSIVAPSAVARPASTTLPIAMLPYGSSLSASASPGLGSPVLVFRSPSQPAMASQPWSPVPESRAPPLGARTPVPAVPISSITTRPATLSAPATPAAVRTSSGPPSLVAAVNTHRMPVATYTSPVVTPVRAVTGSPIYAVTPSVYSGSHAAPAPCPLVHVATANPTPPRSRPDAYPHGTMTAPPAIRSLQATFDNLDTNADGVLSREEFSRWSSQTAGSPVPSASYAAPAMRASYVAERSVPVITQAWPLTNMFPAERLRSTIREPISTTYSPAARVFAEPAAPISSGTCPNCGNVYAADAIFCRRCGVKRQQVTTIAHAQAVTAPCAAPDGTMTAPPAYRAGEAFYR